MTHSSIDPVFHWFLPTRGDSRIPGVVTAVEGASSVSTDRQPTLNYLTLVARAAEEAGFSKVLTPVGLGCVDPWVTCSAIAARTDRLGFLVAFRPSLSSPVLQAQQADTFARLHGGDRIALNIVAGGDPKEQAAYGDHTDHDGRYAAADEALQVIGPLLRGERVSLDGQHVQVVDAALTEPTRSGIQIYLGGASPAAVEVAARRVDTYLLWGEPAPAIADRIAGARAAASRQDRELRFGLRIHILARDTAAEAWAEADRIVNSFDPEVVAAVQTRFARMDSVGQARMTALHEGTAADLVIAPNLWAGIGLVREGVGTALVGSRDEVAARLSEYAAAGIDEFILSGYPHLEEAFRVGSEVVPRVRRLTAALQPV